MESTRKIIRTPDFDAFREWELEHGIKADRRQLSRGRAVFEAGFVALGELVVMRYRESHRWLTEYALPDGVVEICIARYREPPIWCAVEIPAAVVAIHLGGKDYRAVLPGGEAYCIVISRSMAHDWGLITEELLCRAESPRHATASVSPETWRLTLPIIDAWLENDAKPCTDIVAQEAILSACKKLVDACFTDERKRREMPKAGLVDDARELISSRLLTSLTIRDLARDLAVSRRELERAFNQYLRLTPYQYLLVERLHAARSMLKEHQYKTVLEVCMACGFDDASRFAGMYARHFGELPSQTRGQGRPSV